MSPQLRTLLWKEWHLFTRRRGSIVALVLIVLLGCVMGFVAPGFSVLGVAVAVSFGGLIASDVGNYANALRSVPYELLFTQPVPRREILTAKLVVAGALTLAVLGPAAAINLTIGGLGRHLELLLPARPWPIAIAGLACALLALAVSMYVGVRVSRKEHALRGALHVILGPVLLAAIVFGTLEVTPFDLSSDGAKVRATYNKAVTLLQDLHRRRHPGEPLPPEPALMPEPPRDWLFWWRDGYVGVSLVALAAAAASALYLRAAYRAIEEREAPES